MQPKWEIWLDNNLSPVIAKWIKEHTGLEVKSSYSLQFSELKDIEIFRKAKAQGNVIIISKDTDFPELVNSLGAPPKVISIRLGNCDNKVLWNLLKPHLDHAIKVFTKQIFPL